MSGTDWETDQDEERVSTNREDAPVTICEDEELLENGPLFTEIEEGLPGRGMEDAWVRKRFQRTYDCSISAGQRDTKISN